MELYAVCEPWLNILGAWPTKRFGWILVVYLTLSIMYLFVPECVFLYKNYKNVDEFGACFCELMVVCQGVYKLLILMYHKRNWRVVIRDIRAVYKDCKKCARFLAMFKMNNVEEHLLQTNISQGVSEHGLDDCNVSLGLISIYYL